MASFGKKLIYLAFVLWAGGIAPLTYFNIFASDHFLPPYQVAFFNRPLHLRAKLPGSLAGRVNKNIREKLAAPTESMSARGRLPVIASMFEHGTDLPYLTFGQGLWPGITAYGGRLCLNTPPVDCSTTLPPPRKPPRLV